MPVPVPVPVPALVRIFATTAGVELIKIAPRLVDEARKVFESIRGRPRPQAPTPPAESVTISSLRSTVENLQERLEALEAHNESQAELLAHITRYQAALMRRLFWLTLFSVATGALALAAILVAILR